MNDMDSILSSRKWTIEQSIEWYNNQNWIFGCNFLPSTAVNSTDMWQESTFDESTIERELGWADKTGFNSCRVFLQYLVWEADKKGFISRFTTFCDIAQKHNISVVPILFDDCAFSKKEPYIGEQDAPIPGVHNSQWTPSPGFKITDDKSKWQGLESYVKDVIDRFAKDQRILFWDLYNEPGNSERFEKSAELLTNSFIWAREVDPLQPLCAGVWRYNENQKVGNICLSLSDIINFHSYTDLESTERVVSFLEKFDRPLVCTEWLHRINNNTVETHLPFFRKRNIGIFNWGLVKGKTQTNLSWETMRGNPNPNPPVWQHEIYHEDGRPFDSKEISLIRKYTSPNINLYPQKMTPEVMRMLEKKGLIYRLSPNNHALAAEAGETLGESIYECNEEYGPHKLIVATINRTEFEAFGTHPDNEDIFFIGDQNTKPLYLLISFCKRDELEGKIKQRTIADEDFILLRVKYNDPDVSFFTMLKDVPHGEAVADSDAVPPSFYVTESRDLPLNTIDLGDYCLLIRE